MVRPIEDPEQAAQRLLQEASKRGSADNTTIVIVRFSNSPHGSNGSN